MEVLVAGGRTLVKRDDSLRVDAPGFRLAKSRTPRPCPIAVMLLA